MPCSSLTRLSAMCASAARARSKQAVASRYAERAHGLRAGLPQVGDRSVPHLAGLVVEAQREGMGVEVRGIHGLQRLRDPAMKDPPAGWRDV